MAETTPALPPFVTRLRHFMSALARHAADGMQKVSDGELEDRLAVCRSCPSFTGSHCRECGCSCGGNRTFLNKLAWRSEACPLGKWGPSAAPAADQPSPTGVR